MAPGGGKLGGGIDVGSMVGRARAGEAEGPAAAAGPPGWNVGPCMAREGGVAATTGGWSSMGANLAVEADASLRRCESDLRGGMIGRLELFISLDLRFLSFSVYLFTVASRRAAWWARFRCF